MSNWSSSVFSSGLRSFDQQIFHMPLTDIDSLAAAAQEAAPERAVCLDILVAIELHATGRLGCAGKGRQERAGVAPSEPVERLAAHAPQAADIAELKAAALIFQPNQPEEPIRREECVN